MEEIYRSCPEFENNDYILRMVSQEDRLDLLKVYSDKEAVSFFNSDNCGGDDFYCFPCVISSHISLRTLIRENTRAKKI